MKRIHRLITILANASASVPWYLAGGAPAPIAVWEAKGAASQAASYINLVNPGTYNLTAGGVGTVGWNTATGWAGASAANAFLSTGIVPQLSYTLIVRVAGMEDVLADGVGGASDGTNAFMFYYSGSGAIYFRCGETAHAQYIAGYVAAGVIGLAGKTPYINGVAGTAISAGGSNVTTYDMRLLGINNSGSGLYNAEADDYILAAAVYNSTLTASQMSAVSARMAAL